LGVDYDAFVAGGAGLAAGDDVLEDVGGLWGVEDGGVAGAIALLGVWVLAGGVVHGIFLSGSSAIK
jgi:hypothetical protein